MDANELRTSPLGISPSVRDGYNCYFRSPQSHPGSAACLPHTPTLSLYLIYMTNRTSAADAAAAGKKHMKTGFTTKHRVRI